MGASRVGGERPQILELVRGAEIAGRVVDAKGGGVAGATVRALVPGRDDLAVIADRLPLAAEAAGLPSGSGHALGRTRTTSTDSGGRFQLADMLPGRVFVEISRAGNVPYRIGRAGAAAGTAAGAAGGEPARRRGAHRSRRRRRRRAGRGRAGADHRGAGRQGERAGIRRGRAGRGRRGHGSRRPVRGVGRAGSAAGARLRGRHAGSDADRDGVGVVAARAGDRAPGPRRRRGRGQRARRHGTPGGARARHGLAGPGRRRPGGLRRSATASRRWPPRPPTPADTSSSRACRAAR